MRLYDTESSDSMQCGAGSLHVCGLRGKDFRVDMMHHKAHKLSFHLAIVWFGSCAACWKMFIGHTSLAAKIITGTSTVGLFAV